MSLHFIIQSVAIPLWVVRETNAPRWWVSVLMLINTIAVVIFQVAASKSSKTLLGGVKAYRNASLFISLACILYAYAQGMNAVMAALLLTLGMASHIVGELIGSAGSWAIGFGLADENHQGQYQGVWGLSWGLSGTIGPALVTALVIGMGISGWWILAAIFATNLLAAPPTLIVKPVADLTAARIPRPAFSSEPCNCSVPFRSRYASSTETCSTTGLQPPSTSITSRETSLYRSWRGGMRMSSGQRARATCTDVAARTPNARASYEAAQITPREPSP
jgi:MFS family permease